MEIEAPTRQPRPDVNGTGRSSRHPRARRIGFGNQAQDLRPRDAARRGVFGYTEMFFMPSVDTQGTVFRRPPSSRGSR